MSLPVVPTSKPITAAAGPLGTDPAAWAVSWSSGATGFTVSISSILAAATPPAADAALVTSYWSDGPPGTTLENFGVTGFDPPTGLELTLTQAIDAALIACCAVYGSDVVLQDATGALRQAIAACFIVWTINGGASLPGGSGGPQQVLPLTLG